MKQEIKQKWIDALRGGTYQQDIHNLKTNKGYCCLGVLTDLYLKEHNLEWKKEGKWYHFNGEDAELPNDVITWCDWDSHAAETNLINMNDEKGKSFLEISNYIEENL